MSKIEVNTVAPQCGTTLTLGESGDTVTLGAGASQSGFGRTGTVDWDTTAKTAGFTAVSGTGYFVNTTSGAITVTLPAGSAGDIVGISDYASTFQTNNVRITPNGTDKINGINDNATLSTQGLAVSLVYVDATRGWKSVTGSDNDTTGADFISATGGTITTCGDCKIHTFTGPGTFAVSAISSTPANNIVSHMVVGGGGGGGWDRAGGGGAGGFREVKNPVTPYTASPLDGYPSAPNRVTATVASFPITVGAGGGGGISSSPKKGASGSNSVFSTITSAGGGGGGSAPCGQGPGVDGGSAGGSSGPGCGGTGNTPPVSPPQGNNGGNTPGVLHGGGGGGATAAGNPGVGSLNPGTTASNGGAGATSSINGTPTTRGGGGGGGFSNGGPGCSPFPGGQPGPGGGGAGGSYPGGQGFAGTANTGGGGGGGSNGPNVSPDGNGAAGGSGIVIIRYKFQ